MSIFEAMGEALGNAVEKIGETAENSNFKEQLIDLDKPLNFNDPETDSDASDFNRRKQQPLIQLLNLAMFP